MLGSEEIWKRPPYATIVSGEGSRDVLEEMAAPPEDAQERLPDPNDPIWDLGNEAVACGLSDGSENHDYYLYVNDP